MNIFGSDNRVYVEIEIPKHLLKALNKSDLQSFEDLLASKANQVMLFQSANRLPSRTIYRRLKRRDSRFGWLIGESPKQLPHERFTGFDAALVAAILSTSAHLSEILMGVDHLMKIIKTHLGQSKTKPIQHPSVKITFKDGSSFEITGQSDAQEIEALVNTAMKWHKATTKRKATSD